jgi:hypothetical protein
LASFWQQAQRYVGRILNRSRIFDGDPGSAENSETLVKP